MKNAVCMGELRFTKKGRRAAFDEGVALTGRNLAYLVIVTGVAIDTMGMAMRQLIRGRITYQQDFDIKA
jgi:hypothetical protein